ncbi:ATP-binding cassette sub-family C member 9 like protein [Argiope bruennichi]|uniref:ATP-binding cassette sub-family C member 9 like protein n=1 Tax=Argiope bruennichi TaxID=94029 RepID=A0A8T0ETZ1_ARGBR|nr:ATP-binding cassette sub-family C member 9 like protein [Argiope bruennichi]
MNFGIHSTRMRGPANKQTNAFTFKNNTTTRIRQRFFRPPQHFPVVTSPENYGKSAGLKTPLLNDELPSHYFPLYGMTPINNDENYGSEMDTKDYDTWGLEECFEYENTQRKEDNNAKRKNSFVYPPKENLNQKRIMQSITPRKGNASSVRNVNESLKTTPMRQTVLSMDAPNGFGYKLVQKEKHVVETQREENPKFCPKWSPADSSARAKRKPGDKNVTFPRIFTVTVEKLQTWPKVFSCGQIIFELFGILEKLVALKQPNAQMMQLRSQKDRQLPNLVIGTWHRCIILLRYNKEYQCVTIRSATSNELKYLDKLVIGRYKCTKIEKKHGELVRYHEHCSRFVLTLCLFLLNLAEIGEGIMVNQFNSSSKLHIIITPVSSLLSTLSAILFYHYVERLNRPKLLLILFVFWPVAATLKLAKLVTLYGIGLSTYHIRIFLTWTVTLVYSLLTAIDATLVIVQKYFCDKPYHEEPEYRFDITNIQYLHPYVNLFSQATFSWLLPLLKLGYQRPLELADLEGLPEDEKADHQFRRFNEVFMEEKQAAEKGKRRISLWKCYWLTFWRSLFFGGIMKISGDVVNLIGPISISFILAYVTAVKTETLPHGTPEQLYYPTIWEFIQNGFVMAVIVLVATFLQSTLSNNFNHLAIAEGTHLRTALQCLVYKKALKASSASGLDTGAVVNHMAVDAFNMMMLFSMGHYLWAVPFKIVLLLILLYSRLGYSALIGAATVIFLVPVQYYICTLLSKIQGKALDVSDERLKKTTELLQGIKLLKLYGWDRLYANFVQNVREKELKILRSDAICVAFNTFITQTSSIIVTLVTFSLFSKIEGRPIMPADVFTGLALFNQLTVPLYIIPFVIPMVINAIVSTRRLVDFLMLPEVDLTLPWRDDSDAPDARVEFVPDSGSVLLHVKENSFDSKGYLSGSEESDGVFLA